MKAIIDYRYNHFVLLKLLGDPTVVGGPDHTVQIDMSLFKHKPKVLGEILLLNILIVYHELYFY